MILIENMLVKKINLKILIVNIKQLEFRTIESDS